MCLLPYQLHDAALIVSVAGSKSGPMKRLINIPAGADFHVPIETAFAAVHTQAPQQRAGNPFVDHGLDRGRDVRRFNEAKLADEIGLLALRERVRRADRLGKIVVLAPRIMVRRDHVDIRILKRRQRNAVQRAAVDDQVIRIELL